MHTEHPRGVRGYGVGSLVSVLSACASFASTSRRCSGGIPSRISRSCARASRTVIFDFAISMQMRHMPCTVAGRSLAAHGRRSRPGSALS